MAGYTTSSTVHARHLSDWVASLTLLPICTYYVFKGTETTILETLCMLVFDTGRMLGAAIAEPVSHVGGPVLLILVPLLLVWYFGAHGYRFGIQVFLFWLGQNLIFLGRTTMEVDVRHVELLNSYQFDIHAILSGLEATLSAEVIGQILFMLGSVAFITLLILPLYVSR